jgi:hypothetical protein
MFDFNLPENNGVFTKTAPTGRNVYNPRIYPGDSAPPNKLLALTGHG